MIAICAMDLNRGMGVNGGLPWPKIPDDMKWFRQMTINQNLVMGHTTFKSIGPLPGRFIFVLTKDQKLCDLGHLGTHCYVSLEQLKSRRVTDFNDLVVCGGAKVYQQLMPFITDLYVTHVLDEYEADTFMPHFESFFSSSEIVKEGRDIWIVKYSK